MRVKEGKMCIRVECKKCGKYSWSGCGKHLVSLYGNIEKGKHCYCRDWPGVVIPTDDTVEASASSTAKK